MKENEIMISITEICYSYQIPQSVVEEFLACGLLSPETISDGVFNAAQYKRMTKAIRLFQHLELNSAGVLLAMDLLDQIEDLEKELEIARRLLLT